MSARARRWPWVLLTLVAVLGIAAFVGLQMLDSILLKQVRARTDAIAQRLDRPVQVGSLSTRLLHGLAVEVEGLEIGPGKGEDVPLLKLDKVELKAALMQAIRSRGTDVEIRSATMTGLTVNVVRFADGSTNVERVQKRYEETTPPDEKKTVDEKPTDLSAIRVDHAGLSEGKIRLLDRSSGKENELSISHLDVTVNDLRVGKPLEVVLKAAALAERQNVELHLLAAPLPATLIPTPVKLSLKVQPLDLAPLTPFIPRSVGLQQGKVDADLQAELGAAVEGGSGPSKLVGVFHALGMKFAGSEGGKALDVVLDTQLEGDTAAGNLDIQRLRLDFGPAGISGKGKVSNLLGAGPRIDGLEVVGHDLDPAVLARYYPPLGAKLKGQLAGPIGLTLRGAGTAAAQTLELRLDFTPVRVNVPAQLTKAAGAPMTVVAHLGGSATGKGALAFNTQVDLAGVDLRPGGSINKQPGEVFNLAVTGHYRSAGRTDLAAYTVHLLGDTVTGNGWFEQGRAKLNPLTTFELAVKSPHLDLDRMLIPSKETPGQKDEPADPSTYAGLRGQVSLAIDSLRMHQMDLSRVLAQVKLVDDALTLEKFSVGAFGGELVADGTALKLAHPEAPYAIHAQVRSIKVGSAMAFATPHAWLDGNFSGDLNLTGSGRSLDAMAKTMSGVVSGHLLDGTFKGADLLGKVTGPLAKALPFAGAALNRVNPVTELGKDLPLGLELEKGLAKLKNPISWQRPEATMSFAGGIHLDGRLDLAGTVALTPATISALTRGKATVTEPVPVSLKLTGPAWSPSVTDLDLKPALTMLAKQAAFGLADKYLGDKSKVVKDAIGGGQKAAEAAVQAKQAEAQAKINEQRKRVEDEARARSEQLKKQAEEAAKNKLKGMFGR